MRPKRNEREQRPAPAIEGLRSFTAKQGQYLAFIYYYTKIHGAAPAEADFQRFFCVTPPVVHRMIKTLHVHGFIDREPGKARSIRVRLTRFEVSVQSYPEKGARECRVPGRRYKPGVA